MSSCCSRVELGIILTWCCTVRSLNQPIAERATVNILNVPIGQDPQDYININKHFELPISRENMRPGEGVLYNEARRLDTGYSNNISGRSALIA